MRLARTYCSILLLTFSALLWAQTAPPQPIARQREHLSVWHGEKVNDPYYWLRDKSNPEVIKYLEAENAYTEAMTRDLKPFAESKGKGEKGPEQTLPVADKVKVVKLKINRETKKVEAGELIDRGLKNSMFSNISEKGLRGVIITDESNKKITEIRIGGGGKKKGN